MQTLLERESHAETGRQRQRRDNLAVRTSSRVVGRSARDYAGGRPQALAAGLLSMTPYAAAISAETPMVKAR
jgi:hypothetical protein